MLFLLFEMGLELSLDRLKVEHMPKTTSDLLSWAVIIMLRGLSEKFERTLS